MESLLLGFTTNGMTSIFPLLTFFSEQQYTVCASIRRLRITVNPLCQSLFKLSGLMERGKVLTTKLLSQGYQKTKLVATLKKFYGRHHDLVNPYNVAVSRIVSDVFANDEP